MGDSLKKRFSYKLATNFIGLLGSLLVAGIVPRGLGPVAYGNFSFLTDIFSKIFSFFDTGTSTAFYTKLSQHPKRTNIIRFYWTYVGIVIIGVLAFTVILSVTSLKEILLPKQEGLYIIMALLFAVFTWINKISFKIIDAYALTAKGEIVKIIQKVIQVGLIFGMFGLGLLTLFNYFVFNYFILLILSISFISIIRKNGIPIFPKKKLRKNETKAYVSFFYKYSSPLIIFSLFALVEGIFDRWLLQTYAGSEQQGFYGLSLRIASLCFIFSSAMMPLIMREFTIAYKDNNIDKIRSIYLKYLPIFFLIAAFISVFMSIQANNISLLIGGKAFADAQWPIMIMVLYPIHQTFGQLNGSLFLGTNKTKIYSKIGISFLVIGIPATYLMIAPANMFGLNMGGLGLAIKMVAVQLIGVNVEMWFISRILKFPYTKILANQIIVLSLLGGIAWFTKYIGDALSENYFWSFVFSGITYTFLLGFIIFRFPVLIGLKRDELENLKKIITVKMKLNK